MVDWKYSVSSAVKTPRTAPLPLEGDLYQNMELAASLGYDAVEFHTRETFDFDYDRIEQIRQLGKGDISMLVTGRLYTEGHHGMLDEDAASLNACISGMKQYIDKASKLRTGLVLGWVKGVVAPGKDRTTELELLANRLKSLNDYAGSRSVSLMVEVINRYETNIFNNAEETLSFLETNRLDNCFVHLDTFHMNIEEGDPCRAIKLCGNRLGYFHVADNTRHVPGSGQLDFVKMLKALKDIDYHGWIDVECIPDEDRTATANEALQYLKDCEKKL